MSNQDILNQLLPLIQSKAEITLETACKEILDSLAFIELVLHAERLFAITINDDALILEDYVVVDDFIEMIKSHIADGGAKE